MNPSKTEIRVCVDVGSAEHYVAIGLDSGEKLEEFSFSHTPEGLYLRQIQSPVSSPFIEII